MPIKIQGDLPVKEILERENIFVMDEGRAVHQDIRPLESDASERRNRTAASAVSVKHTITGGRDFYGS